MRVHIFFKVNKQLLILIHNEKNSSEMYKLLVRYTLLWSFAFGAILAVIVFHYTHKTPVKTTRSYEDNYENWFRKNNLKRTYLSIDVAKYGLINRNLLESNYLYNHVSLLCVLLVRKRKNAVAANNTWAKHCNGQKFIYLQNEKVQKTMLPIRQEKIESSWHLLCDAVREISAKYQWSLFVFDDMFAVPENVRHMVAALNAEKGHYLGHAISFWGTTYNVGQAGYVLSRGSVRALQNLFNSTEACIAGGRFWRQEDFYLGEHSFYEF